MEAHEFERPAPTRRAAERPHAPEPAHPVETMPSAVLSLQRMAGNESVSALLADDQEDAQPSPVRDVIESGGGNPLDTGARSFLEKRMGQDFADVRVHTGPRADESARAISAQAYTVGTDVVFREGAYRPDTPAGRHVLAHELAHVVQQKAGPVDGTPAPGGISVSHPSDSFEQAAVRTADQVMTAQRAEEDEEAQAVPAQREAEDEEEEPAG
jgi:hypothetical protein